MHQVGRCRHGGSDWRDCISGGRRSAILLLGGDETGEWNAWYDREVPRADDLCDEYLEELRREGLL
jgi:hypothetical protein